MLKWVLVVGVVLTVVAGCSGQAGLFQGDVPTDLGVHDGRLKRPSNTDNSVSSQALLYPDSPQHDEAQIAPLALRGSGPATIAKIKTIVEATDGTQIVRSDSDYLYATYTSKVFRFVDDVEFWYDARAHVVQVRSASRVGKGDLGVNRKRIEALRTALNAAP